MLGRLDYLGHRVNDLYFGGELDPKHDSTVIDPVDLKSLTYLQSVDLSNMHVRESTMAKLAELETIESLRLYNIASDSPAMSHLKRFTALTHISFAFTMPTDEEWLAGISGLGHLKWIDLQVAGIGDKGLANLEAIQTIEYLDLRYAQFFKGGNQAPAATHVLPSVHLGGTMMGDAAFDELREIKSLREVYYDDVDEGLAGRDRAA